MMLANDLKTYYDEVRRYLDCPKDEQDRLLLSVNKQVIELQVDNPNLDYDGIVEFLGEPESLAASLMERLSPDVVQKFKKKKRRLRLSIIACVAVKDNVPPDIEDAKSYIENYYNQKEIP